MTPLTVELSGYNSYSCTSFIDMHRKLNLVGLRSRTV
jgi:hypothetical protein